MSEGRDSRGRFTKGNPGGPGRPRRAVELSYLRVLADSVSLDDWRRIVTAVKSRAEAGDLAAASWLARWLIGANASLTALALVEARGREPGDDIAERAALIDRLSL